jgi:serine/threonine protein kinase
MISYEALHQEWDHVEGAPQFVQDENYIDVAVSKDFPLGRYAVSTRKADKHVGGQGVVSVVWDRKLKKLAAAKRPRHWADATPEQKDKLFADYKREAGAPDSPTFLAGTIPVLDFGTDIAGKPYIIMQYPSPEDYQTLEEWLKAGVQSALTIEEKLLVLEKLATIIDTWAKQGIFSHDHKPTNIMIGRVLSQIIVLAFDHGNATHILERLVDQLSGTVHYLSPELIEQHNYLVTSPVASREHVSFTQSLPEEPQKLGLTLIQKLRTNRKFSS